MSTLDDATTYISQAFGPSYDNWLALIPDDQTKTLNTATRYLNRLPWQGEPVTPNTPPNVLVWPRTGVMVDGVPVDSATTPQDVLSGLYEMAVLIGSDPTIPSKIDQGSNIQAANAGGGTGVTFFSPTSARLGTATVLPVIVQALVGKYLALPTANEGGVAGVGRPCSRFASWEQFTLVRAEE